MGVTSDVGVTPDTKLRSYISNESFKLQMFFTLQRGIRISGSSLRNMRVSSMQLSLVMYARS